MERNALARWILALSLAFVFVSFGIWKFVDPIIWIGFLPGWMEGLMGLTRDAWLRVIGVSEILMGLLLLPPVRWMKRAGAGLIILHLLAILTQVGWNDVAVRDLGLIGAAVALLVML
ncbi:MAG: hypothetical protein Greene041619_725 [Candidatus Peregrinibacteria bacterium Greene0416_19]|nr:MAG: hypothetical protein Greene041619_725 [Candidatus Peregrinibacteria bacterium Greene0416_19]